MILEKPVVTSKTINKVLLSPVLKILERLYLIDNMDFLMQEVKKEIEKQSFLDNTYLITSKETYRKIKLNNFLEKHLDYMYIFKEDNIKITNTDISRTISKDLAGATVVVLDATYKGKNFSIVLGVKATPIYYNTKFINELIIKTLDTKPSPGIFTRLSNLFNKVDNKVRRVVVNVANKIMKTKKREVINNLNKEIEKKKESPIMLDFIKQNKTSRKWAIMINSLDINNMTNIEDRLNKMVANDISNIYNNLYVDAIVIDNTDESLIDFFIFNNKSISRKTLTYKQVAEVAETEIDDLEKIERSTSLFAANKVFSSNINLKKMRVDL